MLSQYRQLPPSTNGRFRHDPMLAMAQIAIKTMWGVTRHIRRPSPPPALDRTIGLRSWIAVSSRTIRMSSR